MAPFFKGGIVLKLKFENYSVSGVSRVYEGFRLEIPGHALEEKAVELEVPDALVDNVKTFLGASHPAVIISDVAEAATEEIKEQKVQPEAEEPKDEETETKEVVVEAEESKVEEVKEVVVEDEHKEPAAQVVEPTKEETAAPLKVAKPKKQAVTKQPQRKGRRQL